MWLPGITTPEGVAAIMDVYRHDLKVHMHHGQGMWNLTIEPRPNAEVEFREGGAFLLKDGKLGEVTRKDIRRPSAIIAPVYDSPPPSAE